MPKSRYFGGWGHGSSNSTFAKLPDSSRIYVTRESVMWETESYNLLSTEAAGTSAACI
jgi:hypothetical protein